MLRTLVRWIVSVIYLVVLGLGTGVVYAMIGSPEDYRPMFLVACVLFYYVTRNRVLKSFGLAKVSAPVLTSDPDEGPGTEGGPYARHPKYPPGRLEK